MHKSASFFTVILHQKLDLKFVKDISVFIGARSNVGQTNWFRKNGTMVDDSRYSPSNQSVCQQMSVPLTYDDGINLLPKRCDQEEAYFACESPSKMAVQLRNLELIQAT